MKTYEAHGSTFRSFFGQGCTRFLQLSSALALLAASNCACPGNDGDGDQLRETGPEMHLLVCAEPATSIGDTDVGGYEDCQISFTDADLSVRTTQEIQIANNGVDELVIVGMESRDGAENVFELTEVFSVEEPLIIPVGGIANVTMSFRPLDDGELSGTLRILSNAINIPQENTTDIVYEESDEIVYFDIPIVGSGSDNGLPVFAADQESCDFGRIAAGPLGANGQPTGGVGNCVINIYNESDETNPLRVKPLRIENIAFLEEDDEGNALPITPSDSVFDAIFKFDGAPPSEAEGVYPIGFLPEDGSEVIDTLRLSFLFSPDAFGIYSTEVLLQTNDPENREVLIDLTGEGVEAPLCAIRVASVNGVEFEPREDGSLPNIEPLDDVVFTAADSETSEEASSIISAEWALIAKPGDSRITFDSPLGVETGFIDEGGRPGVDVVGTYTIRARVQDDLGTWSVNPCEVIFEARPSEDFLAQLTWDRVSDQDLHVALLADGVFCQQAADPNPGDYADNTCADNSHDCYFGNCTTSGSAGRERCQDWDMDGVNGSEGDVCLDRDNISEGYGPENTNITTATPGQSYLVSVDAFGGGGVDTIKLFLFGDLVYEETFELESQDWVEYVIVHWDDDPLGQPCVEILSTQEDECPEFADRLL